MPPGGGAAGAAAAAAAAALPRRFNWFPGHMATAMRDIGERLKAVDLVVEAVDARVPLSGANGALAALAAHKRRIVALNKIDLAEPDTPRARGACTPGPPAPPPSRRRRPPRRLACARLRAAAHCALASAALFSRASRDLSGARIRSPTTLLPHRRRRRRCLRRAARGSWARARGSRGPSAACSPRRWTGSGATAPTPTCRSSWSWVRGRRRAPLAPSPPRDCPARRRPISLFST
jgi:hypothetical protein